MARKKYDDAEIPESLRCSDTFVEAWREWMAYRRERRRALASHTRRRQLKRLAEYGPDWAARAIYLSIEQGWIGLFPDDPRVKPSATKTGSVGDQGGRGRSGPTDRGEFASDITAKTIDFTKPAD